MSEIITCPSGLSGRIRGMKVREERVLADRRLAKSGGQVDELLAACWEETLDAGPYDFGEKPIDWGFVLQGDRFYALLQIRALTYGPVRDQLPERGLPRAYRVGAGSRGAAVPAAFRGEPSCTARREPLRDRAARRRQAGLVPAADRRR